MGKQQPWEEAGEELSKEWVEGSCKYKGPEAREVRVFIERRKSHGSQSSMAIWEERRHSAGSLGCVKEFGSYSSCERSPWIDKRT